ncbi:MAG: OmpH family outer membrane protein [Kangiellaceae bacterium]|jgi:outer membrane protein
MFKKILLTAAIILSSITSAFAADLKIGVYDQNLVLSKVPQVNLISSKLQTQFKDRMDEAKALREDGLKQQEAFSRDAMTLTEAQRIEKQRELQKLSNDLKLKENNLREDIERARNDELKKVVVKIQQTIDKLAKAENYDLIIRVEAVSFHKNSFDISNKLITILSNPAG